MDGETVIMNKRPQVVDFAVIVGYFIAIIGVGIWVNSSITISIPSANETISLVLR